MAEEENVRPGSTDTRPERTDGDQRTAPTDEREEKQKETEGWKPLYSSNLIQYKYSKGDKSLSILFHGNRPYTFRGVPEDVAASLGTASSAGGYFSANIKGKYPYSKGAAGGDEKDGGWGTDRFRGAGATGSW